MTDDNGYRAVALDVTDHVATLALRRPKLVLRLPRQRRPAPSMVIG